MKNKKCRALLFIVILVVSSLFVNTVNAVVTKNENNRYIENNEDIKESKKIGNQIKIKRLGNESDEVHWETGFLKVSTKGKGLVVVVPIKLININAPIITPQYDRFFPLRIDNFATLFVYNDENATTIIEQEGKETIYINGSHSILMGVYKIQFLHLLRMLLQDGVIDGFQRFQSKREAGKKGPLANITSIIINRTIGGPFINISPETYEFLDYMKGTFPRYPGGPILDTPNAIKFREKITKIFGSYMGNTILSLIRLYAFMFPSVMFWNRMPVRTSLLQFEMTMRCYGYTPFVRWTKSPTLQPFVKKVQDLIPDIIHDEPVEFKDY